MRTRSESRTFAELCLPMIMDVSYLPRRKSAFPVKTRSLFSALNFLVMVVMMTMTMMVMMMVVVMMVGIMMMSRNLLNSLTVWANSIFSLFPTRARSSGLWDAGRW